MHALKAILPPQPAIPPLRAPTCGGCFKPVDPETSVKRQINSMTSRRAGYKRALATPTVLHFCNSKCRQAADNAADGEGRYF